ncbi:V-type proton ATPase subunit d 1 [Capsicum annuum]|nr:V-type proton ATPase subunit d 1 [Capsicum annuum]
MMWARILVANDRRNIPKEVSISRYGVVYIFPIWAERKVRFEVPLEAMNGDLGVVGDNIEKRTELEANSLTSATTLDIEGGKKTEHKYNNMSKEVVAQQSSDEEEASNKTFGNPTTPSSLGIPDMQEFIPLRIDGNNLSLTLIEEAVPLNQHNTEEGADSDFDIPIWIHQNIIKFAKEFGVDIKGCKEEATLLFMKIDSMRQNNSDKEETIMKLTPAIKRTKELKSLEYGHMIDNVVLIVTGTLHERDVQELLEKCHPLGMFDSIASLAVAQNMRELYRLVLVDTPLAPYFSECITSEDLDDMNIEIMRNTLYKAYLEDFYRFCQKLGGATAEIMSDLLSFEADRRAVNITINSIGTELTRDDRRKLYSNFGLLYPYGHEELAICEDIDQVRGVMEKYPPYQSIFSKLAYGESQMLDKAFYEEEVKRLCLSFEQQFHYGVFFSYIRLREQEIRNLMWISECVSQNQKTRVHDSVVFIF